ncbi:hypothetical protein E2C01_028631 [Portunus trituberculatus]|uniref:Neurotransmitter-gated ion-channel ligand-binding domain-containing protein n=1 Tax=Portunus trituberculatus TaxID=210409 RepID=A0A5B7EQI2_PORTR|nr:hypothetical protein [Portunus trituberculatus]
MVYSYTNLKYYSGGVEDVAGDSWALLPESLNSDTSSSCPLLRAYQNPATLQDEDGDCESTASVLCHLPEEHRLRLLGLQEEVTLYPIHNSLNVFEDGGNYRLIATGERVKLENVQSGNTLYERVSSSTRQVTGRYKWILPDNTENNNKNRSEVFLTLTGCTEGQFTCSDGSCVSLEHVCNLVNDCQDATDELLCTDRTFLPNTYSKRFSPSQGTNEQTLVGLKITLEQVNHVELTENLLKVVLRLDVMWRDPRVVFKYLQKDAAVILPEEAVQEMWLPCIDLVTAAPEYKSSADFPTMKDKVVTATARTEGFSTVLGHTEVKAFPGAFTDLQAARADEIAFICPLDLFFYPFDVQSMVVVGRHSGGVCWQVCKMPLRLTGPVDDATWNATHMSTALGDHLTLTLLYAHQFAVRLHPDQETAVVVVKLGRRYDAYFINTMLPCMLLEVIGFLTHAFPIQDFSNRCTATLSCLIVKAAFFLQSLPPPPAHCTGTTTTTTTLINHDYKHHRRPQISGTLPKTADPKLVDVWMFGNVFVLSLIFLAHVAVLHVQRRSETSKNTPKEGCVAWDEEVTQQGNGYRLARFVNLVGLATSMLVCIMLLSGIGVAAARGKMAALLL